MIWEKNALSGPYMLRAVFTEGELYFADARTIDPDKLPDIDLICGGFPCQSYAEEIVIPKFKLHPMQIAGLRSKTSG